LAIDVGEAEGLLPEMFDLKFVLFVEADLAGGSQGAGALTVFVDFENHDAKGVIAGAGGVVELGEG
jgi:hypothetical protein